MDNYLLKFKTLLFIKNSSLTVKWRLWKELGIMCILISQEPLPDSLINFSRKYGSKLQKGIKIERMMISKERSKNKNRKMRRRKKKKKKAIQMRAIITEIREMNRLKRSPMKQGF
jgi:hypothetical protein